MTPPILGIWASGAQPAASVTSFESIATVSVGSGGAANVEFTSIPATYTHLQIRGIARSNRNFSSDTIFVQFNGDSSANYSLHLLRGDGSTASAYGAPTNDATQMDVMQIGSAQSTAGVFGGFVIDILDYANTNKYKTQRSLGGFDNNGNGVIGFCSGSWRNTNAITSILLDAHSTDTFQQYSHFALYGIKGAA